MILLDVMMPEMDGYEVCEIFKDSEETQDISIIFQTSKNALANEQILVELAGVAIFILNLIAKLFEPARE